MDVQITDQQNTPPAEQVPVVPETTPAPDLTRMTSPEADKFLNDHPLKPIEEPQQPDRTLQSIKQIHADETSTDAQIAALRKELGVTPEDIAQQETAQNLDPAVQQKVADDTYKQMQEMDVSLQNPDLTKSVKNLGIGFGKGILKFGEDIVDGVSDIASWAAQKMNGVSLVNGPHKQYVEWDMAKAPAEEKVGMMLGRYAAPLLATGPAASTLGLTGTAHTVASSVGAATATMMAMDPEDKNLADMLESFPALQSYVPSFLTTKPDDSMAVKRLKTGVLSLVGDAAMLTTGKGVMGLFGAYKARDTIKNLSRVASTVVPEVTATAEGVAAAAPKVEPIVEAVATEEQKAAHVKLSSAFSVETPTPAQFEAGKLSESPQQFMEDTGLSKQPEYAAAYDSLKRGVQTTEEVTAKATVIANDPKYMTKLFSRAPGTPVNAEELAAMLMHTQREFENVSKLIPADGVLKDPADVAIFGNAFQKFAAIAQPTFSGASEAGRTMRFFQDTFKSVQGETNQIKLMQKYADISGGNLKEMAYFMNRAKQQGISAEKVAASIAKKGVTHKVANVFWEHVINGMFGIKTNIKNAIGNTSMAMMKPLEHMVVGDFSKGYALVHGYMEAMGDAASTAGRAFFKEKFPAGEAAKWSGSRQRATSMGNGELQSWGNPDNWMANLVNTYGYVMTTPSRALEANDLFFGIIANRASRHQQAMEMALDQGLKRGSSEFNEFYRRTIDNPSDEMSFIADKFQKEQTLKTPLVSKGSGESEVFGGKMYSGLQQFMQNAPFGRLFVPFISVNANFVDQFAQRVPGFNLMTPKWKAAMASGDAALKHEAYSKVLLGSSLLAGGAWLTAHGMVRGQGMRDYKLQNAMGLPDEKNMLMIGDKRIPLDVLGPYGHILGMSADIAELYTYLDTESVDKGQDLANGALSILADRFTPDYMAGNAASYFEKITDFQKGKIGADGVMASLGKTLAGAAPLHAVGKDIGKMINSGAAKRDASVDPNLDAVNRVWEGMKHEWISSYPEIFGDSGKLPKQLNIFGEEIKYPHGSNPDSVSPFYTNAEDTDPVRKELIRLGMHAPLYNPIQGEGVDPLRIDMPDRRVNKGVLGQNMVVKMSPTQYEKYVKYSAGIGLAGDHPDLKEAMATLMVKFEEDSTPDELRKMGVKKLIMAYRQAGQAMLMRDDSDITQKLADMMVDRAYALQPELEKQTPKAQRKLETKQQIQSTANPDFFEVGP